MDHTYETYSQNNEGMKTKAPATVKPKFQHPWRGYSFEVIPLEDEVGWRYLVYYRHEFILSRSFPSIGSIGTSMLNFIFEHKQKRLNEEQSKLEHFFSTG